MSSVTSAHVSVNLAGAVARSRNTRSKPFKALTVNILGALKKQLPLAEAMLDFVFHVTARLLILDAEELFANFTLSTNLRVLWPEILSPAATMSATERLKSKC